MNIHDFEVPENPGSWREILDHVFEGQRALMRKYKEIERLPEPPISLHHANGQRILKDFAWRTTEELTEAYEAREHFEETDNPEHLEHQNEELADALHFFIELLIFAGISPEGVFCEWPPLREKERERCFWQATYKLGVAMNFLRNKPWKQSEVPTDEARFREALIEAFRALVHVWAGVGLTPEDLFSYYFRKNKVNEFRQRSNY